MSAAKWRNLSAEEKEKYNKQFNAEMVRGFTILFLLTKVVNLFSHFVFIFRIIHLGSGAQPEYKKQHAAYLKKLSVDQLKAIKAERSKEKKNRTEAIEKKNRKKELLEEGKPKKSLSAYLLFAAAKSKNTHTNTSVLKTEWDNLSEEQKLAYKQQAQQLRDAYE